MYQGWVFYVWEQDLEHTNYASLQVLKKVKLLFHVFMHYLFVFTLYKCCLYIEVGGNFETYSKKKIQLSKICIYGLDKFIILLLINELKPI